MGAAFLIVVAPPLPDGRTWDRRNPHVAATFEPDARIDYASIGPRTATVWDRYSTWNCSTGSRLGGVWASDHFGLLAVLRGRSNCGERDSGSRGGTTSETGD
jgi:hypothetical protein